MDRHAHWDEVYASKRESEVSWFQPVPSLSLEMLDAAGLARDTCVIDIGGGDSRLVDHLMARGLACLAVLDVSGEALKRARARLGEAAHDVHWIEADVTGPWDARPVDIWHDRAVFHFLTAADDRDRYRAHLLRTLKPGGTAVIATFALDGPEQCSGLPVTRYSPDTLGRELGAAFELRDASTHTHATPWGTSQSFHYSRWQRTG
jgi:SAM-dependent methyltransferase